MGEPQVTKVWKAGVVPLCTPSNVENPAQCLRLRSDSKVLAESVLRLFKQSYRLCLPMALLILRFAGELAGFLISALCYCGTIKCRRRLGHPCLPRETLR